MPSVSEQPEELEKQIFKVRGMHCASCVAKVERAIDSLHGVKSAQANLMTEKAVVTVLPGGPTPEQIVKVLREAGYDAEATGRSQSLSKMFRDQSRQSILRFLQFAITATLSIPVISISMSGADFPGRDHTLLMLSASAIAVGGFMMISRAFVNALRLKADMDTLVALGALSAFAYSTIMLEQGKASIAAHGLMDKGFYFETAVTVITFVLFGRWLESLARGRAAKSIKKLLSMVPPKVTIIRGDRGIEIGADEVARGDEVLVRPGGRIPVDGIVLSGESDADESLMTGENRMVAKNAGDRVIAGSINGPGALRIRAEQVGAETAVSRIVALVERAQEEKPPVQRVADRMSGWFVPGVLLLALMTFGWRYAAGHGFMGSFMPSMAVLLVSCPCALGLATPVAVMVGLGRAAERGIVFRTTGALENLGAIDSIVLDKTGTLTYGRHLVTDCECVDEIEKKRLLSLIAGVERLSEHGISRAIVSFAREDGVRPADVEGFEAIAGLGVRAKAGGSTVVAGNAAILDNQGIEPGPLEERAASFRASGKTVVYLAENGKVKLILALSDVIRPEGKDVVKALEAYHMHVLMVTGDTRETALAVGRQAGIRPQDVFSEVRPEDKALFVRQLKADRETVGMVGDGINDAPALAEADVGVAMGAGTDVAIESADVTLSRGDLASLLPAVALSRRTMRVIKENLAWAFAYNAVLIPMAATGRLHPMYAAIAMSMSSVIVVVNSLRIK